MSYYSNKKLVNELIDFIITKVEKRTGIRRQLDEFLEDYANVWIYTEMPPAVKANYDAYVAEDRKDTIHDYRGCCFTNQYIRAKKMTHRQMSKRIDIVIHNLYETKESAAWVLLHEFMHGYLKSENPFTGTCAAVHSMNWVWEDRVDRLHPTMNHREYYGTDEGHELKPEEVFCNLYATSLIGTNYDRHWWRENRYKKEKMILAKPNRSDDNE